MATLHQSQSKQGFVNNMSKSPGKHQTMSASPSKSSYNKTPSKSPMKITWTHETSEGKYMTKYKSILESDTQGKNLKELEIQNGLLRNSLKDFNELLREDLEKTRVAEFVGKKVEFSQKPSDEKLRTIIRELANNEKILSINEEEYRKSQARLEMIKGPAYLLDIQENIAETKKQIEEIRRENKKLELSNGVIGKDLDKIENISGLPSNIEEAQEKERECETLKRKLAVLKQKNAASLEEKEQKLEKGRKLNHQMKNMQVELLGVDEPEDEKLVAKRNTLNRKIRQMEDDLKFTENKYKKFIETTINKELEELLTQNRKDCEHMMKLEDIIAEQSNALKDLVEIESFKQNKGTKQVVERIKESLSDTDKYRGWSLHSETNGSVTDQHFRSQTIKKDRSLGTGLKLRNDQNLGPLHSPQSIKYQSATSKNKLAVKRELGGQRVKSVWKETGNGNEERMNLHLAKSHIGSSEKEDSKLYSKPMGLMKSSREKGDRKPEKATENKVEKTKKEEGQKSARISRKNSQEDVKDSAKKVPKLEKLAEEKTLNRKENSSPLQKSKRGNGSPAPESERKKSSPKRVHKEKSKKEEDFVQEEEPEETFITKKEREPIKAIHKEKVKKEKEEDIEEEGEEKEATFFGKGKNKEIVKSKAREDVHDGEVKEKKEKVHEKTKPQEDDEIDYTRHRRTSETDVIKKDKKKKNEEQAEKEDRETPIKEAEKSKPLEDIKGKKETSNARKSVQKEEVEDLDNDYGHKSSSSEKNKGKKEEISNKGSSLKAEDQPKEKTPHEEKSYVQKSEIKKEKEKKIEKDDDLFDDPFEDEQPKEVKKVNKPIVVEKKKQVPPKKEADDFEEFDFDADF